MQPDCIFCRMASGELPIDKVAENGHAFAVHDINPRAPVHVLIIPKQHIADARRLEWANAELLSGMFMLASEVGRLEQVQESGYRLALNVGEAAGMTVNHLHMHLIAGRRLGPEG